MSIQRPQARPLNKPALEKTDAARDAAIGEAETLPKTQNGATPESAVKTRAPAADRGKFDIVFAAGASVALWALIIFLLAVLF